MRPQGCQHANNGGFCHWAVNIYCEEWRATRHDLQRRPAAWGRKVEHCSVILPEKRKKPNLASSLHRVKTSWIPTGTKGIMIVFIFLVFIHLATPNYAEVQMVSGASVTVVLPDNVANAIGGEHKCVLTANSSTTGLMGRLLGGTYDTGCEEIMCGQNAECKNSKCECKDGYKGDPEFICEYLGRCYGVRCGTNQACNTTNGKCGCNEGYKYSKDTTKCEEWDECDMVFCATNAECKKGKCVCKDGYIGDPEVFCHERVDLDPIDVEFCILQKYNTDNNRYLEVVIMNEFCGDLLTPWEKNCNATYCKLLIYTQYMVNCKAENKIMGKCVIQKFEKCEDEDKTRVRMRINYNRRQVNQNNKYEFFEERFDKLRGLRDPLVRSHYWFPEKHPTKPIGILLDTVRIGRERTELPSTAETQCQDQLKVGCNTVIKEILFCNSSVAVKYCAKTCGHCSTKNRHEKFKEILAKSESNTGTTIGTGDKDWCPGIPDQMCAHQTIIDKCPNTCQEAQCFPANVTCKGVSGRDGICNGSPSDGYTFEDGECDVGCKCWTRPTCVDVYSTEDCQTLKMKGYCQSHADEVSNYCLNTCKNCAGVKSCQDSGNDICKILGDRKLCNAQYTILMGWHKICPKTCKTCLTHTQ